MEHPDTLDKSTYMCIQSNVGYMGNSLRWQIDKTGLLPYEWVTSYSTSKCCLYVFASYNMFYELKQLFSYYYGMMSLSTKQNIECIRPHSQLLTKYYN